MTTLATQTPPVKADAPFTRPARDIRLEREAVDARKAVLAGRASPRPLPCGAGLTFAESCRVNAARNGAQHSYWLVTGDTEFYDAVGDAAARAEFRLVLAARPAAPAPVADNDPGAWDDSAAEVLYPGRSFGPDARRRVSMGEDDFEEREFAEAGVVPPGPLCRD